MVLMTLENLNRLPTRDALAALERCCGSSVWIEQMCAKRPYSDVAHLMSAAERAADGLVPADWREAFAHHPRIGDATALRERFAATARWAGDEQRGATGAAEEVIEALARGNHAYEERFGHTFIVCATGRTAAEMLALLEARMDHTPDVELAVAAGEQRKITRLRLEKLLAEA